jgi:tRNA modification GTPase
MMFEPDTIVAIATAPGRGGIGVVRLSGAQAKAVAEPMLRLRTPMAAGVARFGYVVDEAGEVLDEAVVTYFAGPHSYTSEDVVEIAVHGAPVLLESLVRASVARGARLAEPGEFTERAFLSGRIDLTQAEAVNDLIAARTLEQAKTAAAQLGGAISREVAPVKQRLLELMAGLEAGVDFAEDDLDLMPQEEIVVRVELLHKALAKLAGTYAHGRLLREGARLAIVGRPNAGKSSLFNWLLERERAIVTAQPGTTRDPISETVAIGGIPVELIDTAGLREIAATPETEAEREGIARSRSTMAEADLVLHVVEAGDPGEALAETLAGRPVLRVLSKCDLAGGAAGDGIRTSSKTGEGVAALKEAILAVLKAQPAGDSAVVTNLRQAQALESAAAALAKACRAAEQAVPHEFLLLDLQEALAALDGLTGATTPDDVLGLIFSRFCIGK